jgi:EAL domain-containing protein (putative c-di-GMP-specific phosphodiesterase class I)
VAQGVERSRQVVELLGLGCELGQGYHFSAPLDRTQVMGLLHKASYGYGKLGAVGSADLRLG